jgi:glycosyltransferase involved in cell wall biosynthesis
LFAAAVVRIALFDQIVGPGNPAGVCDALLLDGLSDRHDFTVFASELKLAPATRPRVRHVQVPSFRRPALVAFLAYFARSLVAWRRARRHGLEVDLVQATDCALPSADVCYAHFCHKAFLSEVWPRIRPPLSARTIHTWANHRVRALIEARLMRRARAIVVPAEGLRRDLERLYPGTGGKIIVIRNTVDLERFRRPDDFDASRVRARMTADETDTVFVFVALGHFERKGLPLLLEALAARRSSLESARLWVVGGGRDLVTGYEREVERLGLEGRVMFTGTVDDVRPFLWSADAFVAPSHYEAFSLGILEAAAAGLPLIASRISGSEELLVEGVNGFGVDGEPASLADGLERFTALDPEARDAMRVTARETVEPWGPEQFQNAWADLYERSRR